MSDVDFEIRDGEPVRARTRNLGLAHQGSRVPLPQPPDPGCGPEKQAPDSPRMAMPRFLALRFQSRRWQSVDNAFALIGAPEVGEVRRGGNGPLLMDALSAPHLVPQMNRIGVRCDQRVARGRVGVQERFPLPIRDRAEDERWFDRVVVVGLLNHARE